MLRAFSAFLVASVLLSAWPALAARNPYEVLGVSKDASADTIRAEYRRLAKLYHPDLAVGRGADRKWAEAKFAELNNANEILSDAPKRREFDRGLIDADGKPRPQPQEPAQPKPQPKHQPQPPPPPGPAGYNSEERWYELAHRPIDQGGLGYSEAEARGFASRSSRNVADDKMAVTWLRMYRRALAFAATPADQGGAGMAFTPMAAQWAIERANAANSYEALEDELNAYSRWYRMGLRPVARGGLGYDEPRARAWAELSTADTQNRELDRIAKWEAQFGRFIHLATDASGRGGLGLADDPAVKWAIAKTNAIPDPQAARDWIDTYRRFRAYAQLEMRFGGLQHETARAAEWAENAAGKIPHAQVDDWIARCSAAIQLATKPVLNGGMGFGILQARDFGVQKANDESNHAYIKRELRDTGARTACNSQWAELIMHLRPGAPGK